MEDNGYCYRCGQNRSTHDDGECASVKKASEFAALRIPVTRDPRLEIAKRCNAIAGAVLNANTAADWLYITETLDGIQELVVLETFTQENVRRAQGTR